MRSLLCLGLWAVASCASAQAPALTMPYWMAGYWLSCDRGEVRENWIGGETGLLLGTNITRGEQGGFEFLRVSENDRGGYGYFSMPNGRSPPTEFTMVRNEGQRAVFENLQHDFPQRIIYERDGDAMLATIEDMAGQNAMSWRFTRAAVDTRCPARRAFRARAGVRPDRA